VPAGVLILVVVVLGLIGRAIEPSGIHTPPSGVLVGLIVGIGLLSGGTGYRSWGAFTHTAGLIVYPLLFVTGLLGPAGAADYVGLLFNVGILMLLSGVPSRNRVRAGVGVCLATFLLVFVTGIVEATLKLRGGSAAAVTPAAVTAPEDSALVATGSPTGSSTSGEAPSSPEPASSAASVDLTPLPEAKKIAPLPLPAVTEAPRILHAPQRITLSEQYGRLRFTVPAELPEMQNTPSMVPAKLPPAFERTAVYSGDDGVSYLLVNVYHLAPGSEFSLTRAADGIVYETRKRVPEYQELGRQPGHLAGLPSLRMNARLSQNPVRYARYELVTDGPNAYSFCVMMGSRKELDSAAVRRWLASIQPGPLPRPRVSVGEPGEELPSLMDRAFPGSTVDPESVSFVADGLRYTGELADGRAIRVVVDWSEVEDPGGAGGTVLQAKILAIKRAP
jgi:hypothetical protein